METVGDLKDEIQDVPDDVPLSEDEFWPMPKKLEDVETL